MIHFWIFLVVAAAICYGARRSSITLTSIVVLSAILIPAVAAPLLTGEVQPSALKVATWVVLLASIASYMHSPATYIKALTLHPKCNIIIGSIAIYAVLCSVVFSSLTGAALSVNQILAPWLLYILVTVSIVDNRQNIRILRDVVIWASLGEALLALAQRATDTVVFYETYYLRYTWFKTSGAARFMGTLDHPLVLSMLCVIAIFLLASWKSLSLKLLAALVLALGVAVSQSRTGLFLAIVGVAYIILFSRSHPFVKTCTLGIAGCATAFVLSLSVFDGVLSRFSNDTGSSQARDVALQYFFGNIDNFLLPRGIGASYRVASQVGLITGFENATVIYIIDLGLFVSLLYFGTQLVLIFAPLFKNRSSGYVLAGLVGFILPQSFSSVATDGASGMLLWLSIAFAASSLVQNAPISQKTHGPDFLESPPQASAADGRTAVRNL